MKKKSLIFILLTTLLILVSCGKKDLEKESSNTSSIEDFKKDSIGKEKDINHKTQFQSAKGAIDIENDTLNDSVNFSFKIKYIPTKEYKENRNIKFKLFVSYDGMYLTTFTVDEKIDLQSNKYEFLIEEPIKDYIDVEDLKNIDLTNLTLDIQNLEID